jgi:hypothetical protein
MPTTGNVSCTVGGSGYGTATITDKKSGAHSYNASWKYKLKDAGQKLQASVIRFGEQSSFMMSWPTPPEIAPEQTPPPPPSDDLGDRMINSLGALAVHPAAMSAFIRVGMEIASPSFSGYDASFLANLKGGYDVNARTVEKSGSASHSANPTALGDGSTLSGSIEVKYKLSYNGKSAVRILKPVDGTRRVFGLAADGSPEADSWLIIAAEASVWPPELASQLVWTLEPVGSSKIEVEKKDGGKAIITLKGLPQENSDFGPKNLTARAGDAEDSVTVKLFYRRDAQDHVGASIVPQEPNWSFYWRQTSAAQGHKDAIKYDPACGGSVQGEMDGYFSGEKDENSVFLCPQDAFSTHGVAKKGVIFEGIDDFGRRVRHEWEHRRQWIEWWNHGRLLSNFPCTEQEKRDPDHCVASPGLLCDCDNDGIPDTLEKDLGLDPTKKFTNPPNDSKYPDSHWYVYKVGDSWPIGSANKEDWSYPGKQWPQSQ